MMRRYSMLSPKRTPKGPKLDVKVCENNSVLLVFHAYIDNLKLRLAKFVRQNKITWSEGFNMSRFLVTV